MKKSLRKSLVYLIMTVLVLPTWLVTGMMNVEHAKAASHDKIVINELVPNPSAGKNEWIELFNEEVTPVNLDGWYIKDNTLAKVCNFGDTDIIPAGGYWKCELTNQLNNSGDVIQLFDNSGSGIAIDSQAYDKNPGIDLSIGRASDGAPNWIVFDKPSEGSQNLVSQMTPATGALSLERNQEFQFNITVNPNATYEGAMALVLSIEKPFSEIFQSLSLTTGSDPEVNVLTDQQEITYGPVGGYNLAYDNQIITTVKGRTIDSDTVGTFSFGAALYDSTGNILSNVAVYSLTITADLPGAISAEDFGVVNYDTGLGALKGYTAGFGLTAADFTGASSVVMQLFAAGDQLLQTNTLIGAVSGTQISSPFDVSGTFNYIADGYWTNVRASEYGQSVPATKVVATVTLANGKVVTATNESLTGDDPTTIYPPAITVPASPVITSKVIEGRTIELNWSSVEGAKFYYVYVSSSAISEGQYIRKDKITAPVTHDEIAVGAYGKYYVVVTAEDNYGNVSAIPIASNQTIVNVTAPVTTTAPVPAPAPVTASIAPQAAQAAEPTTTTPAVTNSNTNTDDQGQIKGDETTNTTEKTNWTPWIVLFVLIILAGAATGGYFYWFAGEDEVQAVVKEPKKEEKSEKFETSVKTKQTNNKPNKKSKRW